MGARLATFSSTSDTTYATYTTTTTTTAPTTSYANTSWPFATDPRPSLVWYVGI